MEIAKLVERQRAFFHTGETLAYSFRLQALETLIKTVKETQHEIALALEEDLHKSPLEAHLTEISIFLEDALYAKKHLAGWMKKRRAKTARKLIPARCYRVPEPYGVALIMSPWNYPFMLAMQPLIGAICAGNCAVIKTSAYAPATSRVVRRLVESCFPAEYCAVVEGSREQNEQLLSQRFDYIFFTGSVAVGKHVMECAARNLTPVTLELGGKSPVIVDETAKIDLAAKRLVFAKFINAGQTCVAPDYVFVHESKQAALLEALRGYIASCYPRDAEGEIADYPHIINEKHFNRLNGLLEGQTAAIGGKSDAKQRVIEPTVLVDVSPQAPIMQEEIFGPILPLMAYRDIEEPLGFIRQRPKPLALYLFSEDRALQRRIETGVSFGGGCINDGLLHVATHHLPFGGVGESGMGQYHGRASFDTFTHYKSIVNKGTRLDVEARYRPYTALKEKIMRMV